jgi:ketosteroid isomerase-like protein
MWLNLAMRLGPVVTRDTGPMSERDLKLVRRLFDVFNRGGIEAILEYSDPEVEWLAGSGWMEEPVYRGHEGLRKLNSFWEQYFESYHLDIEELIDLGDRVLVLGYQRGIIRGSGDRVEQRTGWICEFRNGRGVRTWVYFSWEEALTAAGVER